MPPTTIRSLGDTAPPLPSAEAGTKYGTAAMALYLKRTRGIPVLECISSLLFMSAIDLAVVALVVGVGANVLGEGSGQARIICLLVLMGPLFAWIGRRQNQGDVEKLRDILESMPEQDGQTDR